MCNSFDNGKADAPPGMDAFEHELDDPLTDGTNDVFSDLEGQKMRMTEFTPNTSHHSKVSGFPPPRAVCVYVGVCVWGRGG